jgi:carbon storage regulator CsrA
MLVLGRKENQSILIGDDIRVTVVGRCGSCVRIGVEAPGHVRIVRQELLEGQGPGVARDMHGDAPAFCVLTE